MEFKYQFLEKKLNSNPHPLSRAVYRHIEALVVDWCEDGSPDGKADKSRLYEKINMQLLRVGVQIDRTTQSTVLRAVNKIKEMYDGTHKKDKLDPLSLPIEWDNPTANRMGVLDDITQEKHKHRIRRSLGYAERYLCQDSEKYYARERLRYVYWANYLLNRLEATGFLNQVHGIHKDLDLWVLAKLFERRDLLGEDMEDLMAWLSHPPFMSIEDQEIYLQYIKEGKMPELRQCEFFSRDEEGKVRLDADYFAKWDDLEVATLDKDGEKVWTDANAWGSPEAKFYIADCLFSFVASHPEWMQEQLSNQTYLLPSQQLGLFMKWFDVLPTDRDKEKITKMGWLTRSWGHPEIAYKIDLHDFPRAYVPPDVAK
tara:strand:- start:1215 stop:2324 length:1110 start_codon:yes stop_codon:yes gene_type:complete